MENIRDKLTLRACRIITNIKAQELADHIGVTVDTIYKWEKGRSFPNAPQMVEIINFFAARGYVIGINDINFFN